MGHGRPKRYESLKTSHAGAWIAPPFFHQPRLWDTAGKLAARKAPERGLQDFSITDLPLAFNGQLGRVFNFSDRHV